MLAPVATGFGTHAQAIGTGPVMDYLARTGIDVLRGADRLKEAPATYKSTIEYGENGISKSLRDIARIHTAGLGTRIFYTSVDARCWRTALGRHRHRAPRPAWPAHP